MKKAEGVTRFRSVNLLSLADFLVLSMAFHLLLPRALLAQMIQQARAELPNECCGLLAAPPASVEEVTPVVRVLRCYSLVNAAASPVLYESDPHSMFAAVRDMNRHGLDVVAVYHSHPTSAPVPSRTDRERNYSEEVMNFIISLAQPEPEVRAWWLTADTAHEASWEVADD
jgi:proteasome lid subunit RPN8/RPN11